MSAIGFKFGKLFASFSNLTVRFASDNRGAVTIDFTILAAIVVVASIATISIFRVDLDEVSVIPRIQVGSPTVFITSGGNGISRLVKKTQWYFKYHTGCFFIKSGEPHPGFSGAQNIPCP